VRVLGLDPSLTAFGWALHDTEAPVGTPNRCLARGRMKTSPKTEFIDRYVFLRSGLLEVLQTHRPDRVGLEFPIFNAMFSEGAYGVFLYTCEALKSEGCDVVFWTPLQIKAHAREKIDRPKGWKMDKPDMVEAAKADAGGGRWDHNEADAYLCAVLSGRFWNFYDGVLQKDELRYPEDRYFTAVHTYTRGEKAGKTVKRGVIHRESDRFFLWSNT
jgi:hypothetical protein